MDENDMELVSEQKELSKEQSVSEVKDRITNLPDTLIHYILSFLPTKDAVGTSTLSTRWKYMWTSVDNLVFNEGIAGKDPVDKMKFTNFVDSVLNLHDGSNIKKFSITCQDHAESSVNAWISAALQHKVQELNLNFYVKEPRDFIILPKLVCTSESITVLKLQSNDGLVIPIPFSLPNLKILHLRSINYSAALSDQPLFLSCPTLSVLVLDKCPMHDFKAIIISVPTVKILRLYDTYRDSEMKIYAENLISFLYVGGMSNDLSLCNTRSLVDAYVEVNAEYEPKEIGIRASKLLRQLSNVKFLAVTNVTISTLSRDANFYANLPTFHNLIHLELSSDVCLEHIRQLLALIKRSPNVEHILFDKEIYPRNYINRDRSTVRHVPGSFWSWLKSIEFKKFCANKVELILVKVLLQYVTALEKMTIHLSEDLLRDGQEQMKVQKLLDEFPKGSSCCLIDYC